MNKRRKIIRAMASAAGGGVKRPASPSDIIQWLTAYDGVTPFVDRKNEVTSPVATDVNCLSFDGNDIVRGPCDVAAITTASAPFIMKADFKYGSTDSATHQQVMGIGGNPFGGASAAPAIWVREDSQKITFYFKTSAGAVERLNANTAAVVGQRYQVECIYDGDVISMKIDGLLQTETKTVGEMFIASNILPTWNVGGSGSASYPMQAGAEIYSASYSGVFTAPLAEGSGNPYDVSGNDNHATTNTATWTTADDIPSYNLEKGFRVAVQGTPPYIPALADGSGAADGNAITNKGGYVHNGAECSIQQTDSDMVTGGTSFWGDSTPTYDKKTKAQLDTHFNNTNGSYNLWLKYMGDNTYESVQYPLDKEFTPAEVVKNENYFGGTSGALRDVDGEFILDVDGYVIFTA